MKDSEINLSLYRQVSDHCKSLLQYPGFIRILSDLCQRYTKTEGEIIEILSRSDLKLHKKIFESGKRKIYDGIGWNKKEIVNTDPETNRTIRYLKRFKFVLKEGSFCSNVSGLGLFIIYSRFEKLVPKAKRINLTTIKPIKQDSTNTPETIKQTEIKETKSVYADIEQTVQNCIDLTLQKEKVLTSVLIFIRLNVDKGGLEISFDGRPEPEIIEGLKKAGMWYVFTDRKWVCKATPEKLSKVNDFLEQIEYRKAA